MINIKRPVPFCVAAFLCGIVLSLQFHKGLLSVFLLCCAGSFFAFFVISERRKSVALLFVLAGFCCLAGNELASLKQLEYDRLDLPDKEVLSVRGRIGKYELRGDTVRLYLDEAVIETDPKEKMTSDCFLLLLAETEFEREDLRIGNRIEAKARVSAFRLPRNEGNFDELKYYHSCGIAGRAKAEKVRKTDASCYSFRQKLYEVKERLIRVLKESAGESEAAVFAAMITGDRTDIDEETKELYQDSGIAHILAISGLHVSLLAMGAFRIFRKKLRFLPSALLSSFLLLLFCFLSGMQVSAVRAAIMFVLFLAAKGFGKTYDMLNALSLSAGLLLLKNPYYIYHSGFQLSFCAVLAIALLGNSLIRCTESKSRLFHSFLLSGSITLVTLPVIASLYYQIPVYSVFLNLLVIPLMSFVLGSGMVSALFGLISLVFSRFFIGIGVYLLLLIRGVSDILLRFPGSRIVTGKPDEGKVIIYYLLLFLLYAALRFLILQKIRFPSRKKHVMKTMLPALLLCAALLVFFLRPAQAGLKISMLDVGQGECILLEHPAGGTYMIDAGSTSVPSVWKYRVESMLKYNGISVIDYFILTHPDEDHISGLMELLKQKKAGRIRIRHILVPEVPDNDRLTELKNAAQKEKISVQPFRRGMKLSDPELSLSCLHPEKGFQSPDTNRYSVVVRLQYGGFSALFTGDIGVAEEKELLEGHLLEDIDLLKVAHHGSRFSSSEEFLEETRPECALISAGYHNLYGHPHVDTLERIKETGAAVYNTAYCGQITVTVPETFGSEQIYKISTQL